MAAANDYFGLGLQPEHRREHVLVEERALDSYQNVLFSLTLFYARFDAWPQRLVLVSHGFKKLRLVGGHCVAIGWPLGRVTFLGLDPPGMAPAAGGGGGGGVDAMKGVVRAEREWREDPHGRGEALVGKRWRRNPWRVWQGIFDEGEEDIKSRSGLITKGTGEDETLDDGGVRPWYEPQGGEGSIIR